MAFSRDLLTAKEAADAGFDIENAPICYLTASARDGKHRLALQVPWFDDKHTARVVRGWTVELIADDDPIDLITVGSMAEARRISEDFCLGIIPGETIRRVGTPEPDSHG